jgi:predicted secreted hydrolase
MAGFRFAPIFFLLFASLHLCGEEVAYKQAIEPREFNFPADHGSHAGYQTEWWYFTGNMADASGRAFGYQFTIFRRSVDSQSAAERGRTSRWAASDFYLGHLAVSDIAAHEFHFKDELLRGTTGLAGAYDAAQSAKEELRVWLGKWDLLRTAKGWRLRAASGEIALDLNLEEQLAPILHGKSGERGLSRKGPRPGQASYYYSVPRLKTSGSVELSGKKFEIVSGLSWMDHEFGSNQLSKEQSGWEWFAIQLDDGSALMLYMLRNSDGTTEPNSSGTWIAPDGSATYLPLGSIKTTPGRTWTSPHTQASYAIEWTVEIPEKKLSLSVKAAQDDQEVRSEKSGGISYYEGAVRVSGKSDGKDVVGDGYLEITGARGAKEGKALGGRL